jgi:hypothetical protein
MGVQKWVSKKKFKKKVQKKVQKKVRFFFIKNYKLLEGREGGREGERGRVENCHSNALGHQLR